MEYGALVLVANNLPFQIHKIVYSLIWSLKKGI